MGDLRGELAGVDREALGAQNVRHDLRGFWLLGWQDPISALDDGHSTAETGEGLREFRADRAATHDDQRVGYFGGRDRFTVGPERRSGQPVDRRDRGVGASGDDHGSRCVIRVVADRDGVT